MKVEQLIQLLQSYPKDSEVMVNAGYSQSRFRNINAISRDNIYQIPATGKNPPYYMHGQSQIFPNQQVVMLGC
jgi:hypothetical protein